MKAKVMNKSKASLNVSGSIALLFFAFYLWPFSFTHARVSQTLETGRASKIRFATAMPYEALWVKLNLNSGTHRQDDADIRGNITNIHRAGDATGNDKLLGTIMIEGVKEANTNFDKASARVTNETRIFDRRGKERKPASFDTLKTGQKVAARFVGPVAESYPVQATASEIMILN
jgi:Protein of unknown function (DUF3221)